MADTICCDPPFIFRHEDILIYPKEKIFFGSGKGGDTIIRAEVYGCEDSQEKSLHDFVAAWNKAMNLDRFDLA
jgi:hypothetical protein